MSPILPITPLLVTCHLLLFFTLDTLGTSYAFFHRQKHHPEDHYPLLRLHRLLSHCVSRARETEPGRPSQPPLHSGDRGTLPQSLPPRQAPPHPVSLLPQRSFYGQNGLMERQPACSGKDLGTISEQPSPFHRRDHSHMDSFLPHRDSCGHS